jgi:hypothetical protein
MIVLFHELFPLYGGCVAIGLAGAWLAYRARKRAAWYEKAMREATFARIPHLIVQRVR